MNWNKAKNYTIILLLIVNICLFGLNFAKRLSGKLSGSELDHIVKVLEENDITIETDIPKNSINASQLEMSFGDFDLFDLVSLFFGSDTEVKRTEEFNVTIFRSDSKTLRVKDRTVVFENSDTKPDIQAEAADIAEGFMESLEDMFPGFVYSTSYSYDDSFIVEYDMYYRSNNCFNNSCRFVFDENGMTMTLNYSEPVGFTAVKSELYNADIILFSFMNKMRELHPDEKLTIKEFQLGYYGETGFGTEEFSALPCYRIRVRENDEVYYVNGYTANFVGEPDK